MGSRNLKDLHPELVKRWKEAVEIFAEMFPDLPRPFLTQTFRSPQEQNELYAQGRAKPGKVVTNAKGGRSLHNYTPALAFDIAFKDAGGKVSWDIALFRKFAGIAKKSGLAWGGDWQSFKDYPHFQPPNYTWQSASNGIPPQFS